MIKMLPKPQHSRETVGAFSDRRRQTLVTIKWRKNTESTELTEVCAGADNGSNGVFSAEISPITTT